MTAGALEADADRMRRRLAAGDVPPDDFRRALAAVPPDRRDAWVDRAFGLDGLPADGPALPRGCVPYLPSDVDLVLRMLDAAEVTAGDVFVDIGSGVGRVTALAHCVTGAHAIGIEVQPELVRRARALSARLNAERVAVIEGDAAALVGRVPGGTVFFLYCPFSGPRLARVLDDLAALAEARPIRVCSLDLPLPPAPWLTPIWRDARLLVCRSGPSVNPRA